MTPSAISRILYVEDDPHIQAVAQIALEDVGGFTVEMAGSGKEAIEKAKTFLPDLILLDIMMPEMDGVTTFHGLKEIPATAHIPVIFLTAKVQPKEVASYRKLGALDVLSKPFDPMSLSDEIRRIWEKSQQHPFPPSNGTTQAPAKTL